MIYIKEPQKNIPLIDWEAPWLSHFRLIGQPIYKKIELGLSTREALNESLNANRQFTCPVRFVPQSDSQGAAAYESFIWQTKTVPTRDNLHDFFNGLVWLHFPTIKTRLNELQASAINMSGVTTTRGKLRDALTLFDENAAFLIESNPASPILEAIRHKAWHDAFVTRRAEWARTEVIIFGHALLEKLVSPRKPMTAHVFCPPTPLDAAKSRDTQLAAQINAAYLATKPYAPLPVMGVPGWSAQNEEVSFYDDAQVFRAAKLC